jgi:hypothetical protein
MKTTESIVLSPPPALVVIDWLLTGATEQQIREALAEKYPECDPTNVMLEVQTHLQAAGRPNTDAVKGWALMAYRKIYQQMLQIGDYSGALKAVKEITNLV